MAELNEHWVDDPDELARRDSREMLRGLATAGAQAREAITLATEGSIERIGDGSRPRSVLVAAVPTMAAFEAFIDRLAAYGRPSSSMILSHPLPWAPVTETPGGAA